MSKVATREVEESWEVLLKAELYLECAKQSSYITNIPNTKEPQRPISVIFTLNFSKTATELPWGSRRAAASQGHTNN